MTTPPIHPPARALALEALDHGWSIAVRHGESTGGHPYVSVEAAKEEGQGVRVTWHTRETGSTFRLFSVIIRGATGGWKDGTLTKARAALAEGADQ